jgi:hypothetical protein
MMQHAIFLKDFIRAGYNNLKKMILLFQSCIFHFFIASVYFYKKLNIFYSDSENQHFSFKNVGFLFFIPTNSKNQYLRQ